MGEHSRGVGRATVGPFNPKRAKTQHDFRARYAFQMPHSPPQQHTPFSRPGAVPCASKGPPNDAGTRSGRFRPLFGSLPAGSGGPFPLFLSMLPLLLPPCSCMIDMRL